MRFTQLALASFLVIAASQVQAQNLLTNGSFETGNFVANSQDTMSLSPGATDMTGWTVTNTELAWIGPSNPFGVTASEGNYSLDLTGYHDNAPYGGVQQSLMTTPGAKYTLAFDLGGFNNNAPYAIIASAGSNSQTFTYTPAAGPGASYHQFGFGFVATGASTLISLVGSASGSGNYIALDNVSVTAAPAAVPEPGSIALFAGMGVTGAAFLKRRKTRA